MTRPPWHITHTALSCWEFSRGRDRDNPNFDLARTEILVRISYLTDESYRSRDRYGRELWRSTRRVGEGYRWVVDTRVIGNNLPELIWVGQGPPPLRVFAP